MHYPALYFLLNQSPGLNTCIHNLSDRMTSRLSLHLPVPIRHNILYSKGRIIGTYSGKSTIHIKLPVIGLFMSHSYSSLVVRPCTVENFVIRCERVYPLTHLIPRFIGYCIVFSAFRIQGICLIDVNRISGWHQKKWRVFFISSTSSISIIYCCTFMSSAHANSIAS